MEAWLQWARGPLFVFALSFMLLGLIRHVALTSWQLSRAMRRAGDKSLPWSQIVKATFKWLLPVGKIRQQWLFSLTSVLFHAGILIVPLFLQGHIVLWARGLGVSWPGISNQAADVLTIVAIITAVALVIQRLSARASRSLSRFQDYALPLIIAIPFATGFLAMHPQLNPFSFEATLLVHVLSANLLLILIPVTKLSHAALIPSVQLVSEVAWHWPSESGTKVGMALGKQGEPL